MLVLSALKKLNEDQSGSLKVINFATWSEKGQGRPRVRNSGKKTQKVQI